MRRQALPEFSPICKQDFYNLVERVGEDWKSVAEPGNCAALDACLEELLGWQGRGIFFFFFFVLHIILCAVKQNTQGIVEVASLTGIARNFVAAATAPHAC